MPRRDQGVTDDRYALIPRTLVFLTREDRVLLLKGAPHKRLWANRYNGVGGHVERGEDVLSAAHRELIEETGFDVPDLWLCGTITIDTGENTGVAIFVFRGEVQRASHPASTREGTLEWVPQSQVATLPLVEDLGVLLPRVLAMQRGDPPFAAHYTYNDQDQLEIRFAPQAG